MSAGVVAMLDRCEARARRLLDQGLIVFLACLFISALNSGCGMRAGDSYTIGTIASLYRDPGAFRNAVQRASAKVEAKFDEDMDLIASRKLEYLEAGATVTVVEVVDGGAKVAVTSGKLRGELGWMLADSLKPEWKR